jgi:hypothetical protein
MAEPGRVQELCHAGLQVTFETVATLHQCALFEEGGEPEAANESSSSASLHWEVLQYGIPVVIANSNGVVLCLADIESGDKVCEFQITTSSQYVALESDFHVLAVSCGCFGISFADTAAGEKLLALLKQVVPCVGVMDLEPSAKQRKVDTGEAEEVQDAEVGDDGEMDGGEGTDEIDGEGTDEVDGEGTDEVDGGFFHRRKSKEKRVRPEISNPKDFQHLSHVGVDTAISELTKSMCWTETLKRKERIVSQVFASDIPLYSRETNSVSTTSLLEFESTGPPAPPPGPPPPPAPPPPSIAPPPARIVLKKKGSATEVSKGADLRSALADELKKGVVLRPVGSDKSSISSDKSTSSEKSYDSLQEELKKGVVLRSARSNGIMTLPMPPRRNKSEELLFEIKTFRRKKLRHVSSASANMTDFSDDKSLESVMKRGLASMFKKMSDMEVPNVGSVSGSGEDTFDGLLE